ncbi:hypothetical protein DFH07DRAFT_936247 [Mycena maculata]|uniref:Uncharacterized protein n=1 Tax=Mycena maculata TaxID=230809 RepID=A0AAD7K6J4_9AGAR|nr:hypothetical protein DFH07DRAFT_936247 [Mycena maculata]
MVGGAWDQDVPLLVFGSDKVHEGKREAMLVLGKLKMMVKGNPPRPTAHLLNSYAPQDGGMVRRQSVRAVSDRTHIGSQCLMPRHIQKVARGVVVSGQEITAAPGMLKEERVINLGLVKRLTSPSVPKANTKGRNELIRSARPRRLCEGVRICAGMELDSRRSCHPETSASPCAISLASTTVNVIHSARRLLTSNPQSLVPTFDKGQAPASDTSFDPDTWGDLDPEEDEYPGEDTLKEVCKGWCAPENPPPSWSTDRLNWPGTALMVLNEDDERKLDQRFEMAYGIKGDIETIVLLPDEWLFFAAGSIIIISTAGHWTVGVKVGAQVGWGQRLEHKLGLKI